LEDLVNGTIPFDLLPPELQEVIYETIQATLESIEQDNPTERKKLDPTDIEARFHKTEGEIP
jgi:hypothetical protein